MMDKRVEIIFENDRYLVIHKRAGIAVQTASVSSGDVCSELKNHLRGGYLGVIHRLDQPVEGLLVFAKDKKTAAALTEELAKGRLKKSYKAVCIGKPIESGTDICYMRKGEGNRCEIGEGPDFKRAELSYKVLDSKDGTSLLNINIGTGRFHQIRAQMAHMGFPLIGDEKYGSDESLKLSDELRITAPALCADRLSFYDESALAMRNFSIWPENPAFLKYDERFINIEGNVFGN